MNMFRFKDVRRLCFVAYTLLGILIVTTTCQAGDQRYLWQSREQFVALEKHDSAVKPNDHPAAAMTQERLSAILASITIRATDSDKPEALLTKQTLEALAPHLLQGLHQASPGEDVTFAIIGLYDALYGLAKSPQVTTGRVFYSAGQLNFIFGLVHQEVRDRDDRRLFPFTPGNRQKPLGGEWTLRPPPDQKGFAQTRRDWITFSEDWQTRVLPQPVAELHAPAVQPIQPVTRNNDRRTPSERLITLNELKNKGLISEEEYRGKRLEILNGL